MRETVEKPHSCSSFGFKHYDRIDRKQPALSVLTENINLLTEIKQILEEDEEEALENLFENFKSQKRKH